MEICLSSWGLFIRFFFYKHQMKAAQLGHLGGDKAWLADRLTVIAA